MAQPIVLVIFSCQSGETEKLALSAAVGAVQARALIRLRRLPDAGAAESNEDLIRMQKEYVPPTEADILGADALILASSSSVPWHDFLALLRRLRDEGKLRGKVGAAIGGLAPMMTDLGFMTIQETPADPVALGRAAANKARKTGEF